MTGITCSAIDEGQRIDVYLSGETGRSRSFVQKITSDGLVKVNGKVVKPGFKLSEGDEIEFEMPECEPLEITAENIPLDIVYEDDDLIVVNKPKGMVVHPAAGNFSGTLVNALMYHCGDSLSGINGVLRPGIVHRIDKDTTGLLVACKNDRAHTAIAEQLAVHSITRVYHAIVYNPFDTEEGTVDAPIARHPVERKKMAIAKRGGKRAVTHFHLVENLGRYAYITLKLETGRTHQIRVHMASIHHPLLGDTVYGPKNDPFKLTGQALHAGTLGFVHPSTGEYMEFHADPPAYFSELLEKLRKTT
ncbi:MAG: RluA family pseudouridine synthase [Lachnospiraceae bacterium]|nr:RluA family pseudouridine synthase [Lachnospiraceae bacterium]